MYLGLAVTLATWYNKGENWFIFCEKQRKRMYLYTTPALRSVLKENADMQETHCLPRADRQDLEGFYGHGRNTYFEWCTEIVIGKGGKSHGKNEKSFICFIGSMYNDYSYANTNIWSYGKKNK